MTSDGQRHFRHKAIRDPLYGFIGLSEIETRLIDTPAFRRLHRIKQLAHTFIAYPSAVHTRFEHSLGCMDVASRMCDELNMDKEAKELVRLAALLHDIGHGPFSHLFEGVVDKRNHGIDSSHEAISRVMIEEDEDVARVLGERRHRVAEILGKSAPEEDALASSIVSGSLDADKLDYMLRDSHHIGVSYGRFDLDRILHTIRKNPEDDTVCVDIRGKDAVEGYRLGRHLLHVQVYHHHARLVADKMFLQALNAALDEGVIDENFLKRGQDGDDSEFLKFYKSLDDSSIYEMIMRHNSDSMSKKILQDVRHRRLLKRACDFTSMELMRNAGVDRKLVKMEQDDFDSMAREVAGELGLEAHQVIFLKAEIGIKLYGGDSIQVIRKEDVMSLSQYSPITAKSLVIRYLVYGPGDSGTRRKIADKIAERLRVPVRIISYQD